MIRYLTAGESHGRCVTAVVEGLPAGLSLDEDYINRQLARRQAGYGRGERMAIERDTVSITSGVRWGETIGGPVCMTVANRDWENWQDIMSVSADKRDKSQVLTRPRPGHADLAGALKYDRRDMRDILERASARETAARVAAGAAALRLLNEFGINVYSFTKQIGNVCSDCTGVCTENIEDVYSSPLRCVDKAVEKEMMKEIDKASAQGDTIGGVFTVIITGVPAGLGSHAHWDLKLDARIAAALMSIQGIKGVETGIGFEAARLPGSQVHDTIEYDSEEKRFFRSTNNSGGFEGGITNGEDIVFNAAMKPISSLRKPLGSVDMISKESVLSEIVRSDVCAVPAAGIVGEAAAALEVARALKEKTGGDSITEMKRNFTAYIKQIAEF